MRRADGRSFFVLSCCICVLYNTLLYTFPSLAYSRCCSLAGETLILSPLTPRRRPWATPAPLGGPNAEVGACIRTAGTGTRGGRWKVEGGEACPSNFEASDTLVREAHGVIISFEHTYLGRPQITAEAHSSCSWTLRVQLQLLARTSSKPQASGPGLRIELELGLESTTHKERRRRRPCKWISPPSRSSCAPAVWRAAGSGTRDHASCT